MARTLTGTVLWQELGWQPSPGQEQLLLDLQDQLRQWNGRVNLTRLVEDDDFWIAQVFDSLWPWLPLLRAGDACVVHEEVDLEVSRLCDFFQMRGSGRVAEIGRDDARLHARVRLLEMVRELLELRLAPRDQHDVVAIGGEQRR